MLFGGFGSIRGRYCGMGGKEMENVIKFALDFDKLYYFDDLLNQNRIPDSVILLDAHEIECKNISPSFIDYDTKHKGKTYPLDLETYFESCLLLIFHDIKESKHTFTTLRKASQENRLKYFKNIGEEFAIEIQG